MTNTKTLLAIPIIVACSPWIIGFYALVLTFMFLGYLWFKLPLFLKKDIDICTLIDDTVIAILNWIMEEKKSNKN